jgi:hypothetical protein
MRELDGMLREVTAEEVQASMLALNAALSKPAAPSRREAHA